MTAPTIAITAPAHGATVSATVNIRANASDDVAVAVAGQVAEETNVGS